MPPEENKQNTEEQTIGIKSQAEPKPVSVEVSTEPKIKENAPVLNEIPKKVIKLEDIPEQTTNSPVELLPTKIKPKFIMPEELPPSATLPEEKPQAPKIQELIKETSEINPKIPEKKPPVSTQILSEIKTDPASTTQPQQQPAPVIQSRKISMRELFIKAQNAIQIRKRKKLNKVMTMFLVQEKITNDQVEKILHVSDSTATRYLAILKKEGKVKQNGRTGKWVYYTKI